MGLKELVESDERYLDSLKNSFVIKTHVFLTDNSPARYIYFLDEKRKTVRLAT